VEGESVALVVVCRDMKLTENGCVEKKKERVEMGHVEKKRAWSRCGELMAGERVHKESAIKGYGDGWISAHGRAGEERREKMGERQ